MDISIVSDFISNIGFPILVAVMMIQQGKTYNDAYLKLYYELKDTIEKNTKVNEELANSLRERNK